MKGAIRYTPPSFEEMEVRRPGITEIANRLRKENPQGSEERLRVAVKEAWQEQYLKEKKK